MMAAFASGFRDGVDINLGVGYVNEKTIPVALLAEALQAVAADPAGTGRPSTTAAPARLRQPDRLLAPFPDAPADRRLGEATVARKRLIVGPCGATSMLDALTEVLAPGIVVASDPMYYIYREAWSARASRCWRVPEDGEGLDVGGPRAQTARPWAAERPKIAFFYVVTVNNPSGTMLSNARRRALYEVAARLSRRQGRRCPIFFDLAYELLLHDPEAEPFRSVLPEDDLGIAYEIGTLSKILAPAMRIGLPAGA